MQGSFPPFQKPVAVLQPPSLCSDPTCLVLINSLYTWVTPSLQLLSPSWFVIILHVTWPRTPPDLTFSDTTNSSCSHTHSKCLQNYFRLCFLPVSKFATSSSASSKPSIRFWLPLIYVFFQQQLSHPSPHYHFNRVILIHALMRSFSTPVILSIRLFSTNSISFHFIMFEKLLVLHTSHLLTLPALSYFLHSTLTYFNL